MSKLPNKGQESTDELNRDFTKFFFMVHDQCFMEMKCLFSIAYPSTQERMHDLDGMIKMICAFEMKDTLARTPHIYTLNGKIWCYRWQPLFEIR